MVRHAVGIHSHRTRGGFDSRRTLWTAFAFRSSSHRGVRRRDYPNPPFTEGTAMDFDEIPREGLVALLRSATQFDMGQAPLVAGMTLAMRAAHFPDEVRSWPVRVSFCPQRPSRGEGFWVVSMEGGWLQSDGGLEYYRSDDKSQFPDAGTAMEYYRLWAAKVSEWASTLTADESPGHGKPARLLCDTPNGRTVAEVSKCPHDLSFAALMPEYPLPVLEPIPEPEDESC